MIVLRSINAPIFSEYDDPGAVLVAAYAASSPDCMSAGLRRLSVPRVRRWAREKIWSQPLTDLPSLRLRMLMTPPWPSAARGSISPAPSRPVQIRSQPNCARIPLDNAYRAVLSGSTTCDTCR